MRGAIAVAAALALALAACQVNVEGAQCDQPGSAAQCPSGQACGNDGRCSEQAAACADPAARCEPGTSHCGGADGTELVATCSGELDPVCGAWQTTSCKESGLVCEESGVTAKCAAMTCASPGTTGECPDGQACGNDLRCSAEVAACLSAATFCVAGVDRRCSANRRERCDVGGACGAWTAVEDCGALFCDATVDTCRCAEPAGEIAVDPASRAGTVAPTGAAEPPECRFKKLGDGLAYARDVWQPAHGGVDVIVRARGTPGSGAPIVFDSESFPLVVTPGVTLAGGTSAAEWIILASASTPENLVEVHDGGRLESFTIRGAAGATTGHGLEVVCGSDALATAHAVTVDGATALTRGVSVVGGCGLEATDLRVERANGPGVYVDAALTDPAVPSVGARIDQGWMEGNAGAGVEVRGGKLTLNAVTAIRNGGFGVKAQARDATPKRAIALEMNDSRSQENESAGLLVKELAPDSSLQVRRSWFKWNKATTEETQFTATRRVGGVWLYQSPPATLVFEGNRIYGNANPDGVTVVDQLAMTSASSWNLSAPACGASGNVFACPGNGHFAHGTIAAPVIVRNAYWPPGPDWPPTSLVTNAVIDPTCDADPAPIPTDCTP